MSSSFLNEVGEKKSLFLQITWLEGHSLAQTVFTCLYVHNPDLIEDPAMKAFALGILKICDIAREKVNKAAVFEEVHHL